MPELDALLRVLSLSEYNTRLVVLAATVLGLAAGVIGTFMLLRKRALLGDALSHATLPGVGLAFVLASLAGAAEKSLPVLLTGAALTGAAGALTILVIRRYTRLKEDAALGITLSVFFGAGVAVLGVIQQMGAGSAAGLKTYIYGSTASMIAADAWFIAAAAGLVVIACALLFKEFRLLCFDAGFAHGQGWPVTALDAVLAGLVVMIVVVGLQAVGAILIIAMLIVPAAAARFWSDRLAPMACMAAVIGAGSAALGALVSALFPGLPSGAMIVLVAVGAFVLSMLLAPRRGIASRWLRRRRLNRRVDDQHLLRAMYEAQEARGGADSHALARGVAFDELLLRRSWGPAKLKRILRRATRAGLVHSTGESRWALSTRGRIEAARVVRNHRLWEVYLISYADIAPNHVDRDADRIEHVLSPEMIAELEALLERGDRPPAVPASPHEIVPVREGGVEIGSHA
ncbi:MAG: metal ABC transporter permease [Gammaproteobacteria bacterium]